jgi:hypothetical protein
MDGVVNCIILLICKFFITTYGQFNVLNHNCDHKFNFTCIDTIGHIVFVEKNPIKKTDQNGRKMDYWYDSGRCRVRGKISSICLFSQPGNNYNFFNRMLKSITFNFSIYIYVFVEEA